MNVFVTRPTSLKSQSWEASYAQGFSRELNADPAADYRVVERAEAADIIILMESNLHKEFKNIPDLRREPILSQFCAKVGAINYEDKPAGFLRGLYTSLEKNNFDPALHKSWPAFYLPNGEVYQVAEERIASTKPVRLFTFVGSLSHPLRSKLLEKFARPNPKYQVCLVNKWFNHDAAEKANYVSHLLASQFVLCPRGHANYTHRIVETMALGRVPVVLADGWIPFSIPEKDYFIRVPEAEWDQLEQRLEASRPEAAALGRRAREIWLKYFAQPVRARAATNAIRELIERAPEPFTFGTCTQRWQSFNFLWQNQMTLGQRIARKFGDFIKPHNRQTPTRP